MKIGKPKYSFFEILEQFENKQYESNIEKTITLNLINILGQSDFYLFTDNYKDYVSDMLFEKEKKASFSNLDENVTVEYFDESLDMDILINIISSKNPLFKKLRTMIGDSSSEDSVLVLFYYKDRDGLWNIPIETILIKNNKLSLIEIYKNRSFELKNNVIKDDDFYHLQNYTNTIFNMYINIKKLLTFKNMEYVNIPMPKSGLYYKIPHVFFRKSNIINKREKESLDEKELLSFSKSIYILKNKLFFK